MAGNQKSVGDHRSLFLPITVTLVNAALVVLRRKGCKAAWILPGRPPEMLAG
ncbi:hypothetical protein DSECCO2_81620 [anaerobic digester metagenome]|jgi:hypothetical protein